MTEKAPTSGPFGRLDPSLPRVFGRYLLVQRLARGGMGEVFLAKHGLPGFEKLAVIKKVLPHLAADAQFIARFVDEAQVAIKLQHVNVAQVFEVGRVGDEYFLALEYVEGRDLRRTLAVLARRRERMPVDLALFIARELANGLAYAHRRTGADGSSLGLVHCDISPPNVLVSFEGETKVIDFGIAKSALRGAASDPKLGFGKFGYMAPEQLLRGGVVEPRTDIYAAGVVLFELLTCQRLYEIGPEPDYRALARKVARGEHPIPSEIDPMLAPYDRLVATALRPKPEDRYPSAAALRDAIQHALVMVNPTISTDRLGAFMSELFAEEMAAQRELHDRVASAHLADFQEQFHTQTISTVSFALAQLPLQAPPEPPAPPRGPAVAGRAAPVSGARDGGWTPPASTGERRHPALDTAAPATDLLHGGERDPERAGRTDARPRAAPRSAAGRRRRWLVAASLAVIAGSVITVLAVIARDGQLPDRAAAAGGGAQRPRSVTIIPIDRPAAGPTPDGRAGSPPDGRAGPTPDGRAGDRALGAPGAPPAGAREPAAPHAGSAAQPRSRGARGPRPERAPERASERAPERAPQPGIDRPGDRGGAQARGADSPRDLTRAQVGTKLTAVRREYAAFKARNGDRLEQEWGDLATFMTYQLTADNLEEAARRIEAFRAKLRE
jgi:serine/threonine protein kinase